MPAMETTLLIGVFHHKDFMKHGNTENHKSITEETHTHPQQLPYASENGAPMHIISLTFPIWSRKKTKTTYTRSSALILAKSSAFIFLATTPITHRA
ncbi:hypothetical protein KEJ15_07365 [Candidatus Bathyarchaeota archaeon]|nr:hypothetical protein [Candidatus Bathyarchaeota archaeon]